MDGDLIIQLLGYLLTPLAGGIAWFFGKRSRNADETLNEQSALEEMQNTINSFAADNKKLYDEVFIKYKEGSAGYIELIDAQTQYTQIRIQHLLANNNAWMKWAEYVYVAAIYPIQQ